MQLHQSIGAAGDRWIVRDHHDGQAITMLFGDEVENLLAGHFVEVAGGLVSEQDLGLIHQSAGHGDALALAA